MRGQQTCPLTIHFNMRPVSSDVSIQRDQTANGLTAREIAYNNIILKYHSWYLCQISLLIMLLPILILIYTHNTHNPHWRKITCDKINPWNGNSTVFLYHISPKSVHFSSFFGFVTNKETIQYIVKAVVIIFAGSLLSSASISEK